MSNTSQEQQRRDATARRRKLADHERARHSQTIASRFLRSKDFLAANHIACFISSGDEVDTSAIFARAWRAGKCIYAPVVLPRRQMKFVQVLRDTPLKKSAFGLWEPVFGAELVATKLDVVVTPLLAFDARRYRVGVGGGYYDRAFAHLQRAGKWLRPKLVGVAFECQRVEKIRPNPWDIRLSRIFTEHGER